MNMQCMRHAGVARASRRACALMVVSALTAAVVPDAHPAELQAPAAAAGPSYALSIPAQPLDAALRALSRATRQKIQYGPAQGGPQVSSQIYHQLFGSYTVDRAPTGSRFANGVPSDLVVNFGIHNVFNKVPPLDAFYYPVFTSPFGSLRLRSFDVNVKKSF